jgi:hypothetical protein
MKVLDGIFGQGPDLDVIVDGRDDDARPGLDAQPVPFFLGNDDLAFGRG